MAEPLATVKMTDNRVLKCVFAVTGIMSTLLVYGILQEKIMRVPYGVNKEFFRYSLFLVFCNRIMTSAVSGAVLLASKKSLDPVAPIYKYCAVSVSNILTTTCQYEVWGTIIMQKKYNGKDYLFALFVTIGCAIFILYPASTDITPYNTGRESTIWGVSLMLGYLGFDGFTSTFQDKLFRGYEMEIHNQIFYTTICSCLLSLCGLILQGHLLSAVDFMFRHQDCFYDVALLSSVATASQFFISYTIRTFGALTFATIMTTRQFAPEIRQRSSNKATGILIKELIDEETSKWREFRHDSPGLIARLMGLDTLPSPLRQQKIMDCYCQKTLSVGLLGNYVHHRNCSHGHSNSEDQEFIDVFEVTKTSKKKKHRIHGDSSQGMLNCKGNESHMDFRRHIYLGAKGSSTSEVLNESKESDDASGVSDSSDELLRDPKPLFANHLRDLNRAIPLRNKSKNTKLRPSKSTMLRKIEMRCKSSKSERNPDSCFHVPQEFTGSCKMHEASLCKNYFEEDNDCTSHNSPARIVILKPNLKKAQKWAEANFSTHEDYKFRSKRYQEIAASGIQEPHSDGRNKQKFFHHVNIWNRKVVGSSDDAGEIARKIRHTTNSRTKKNFASEINPYSGTIDSFSLPGNHTKAKYQSHDYFGKWSYSISPASLYSSESSVSREARSRLIQRWKITRQFQDMRLGPLCSNTLREILALSDRETLNDTVNILSSKNVSDDKVPSEDVLGRNSYSFSISSKNDSKDGSSISVPRSKSQLAASCHLGLGDKNQEAEAEQRKPLVKSSKHHTDKSSRNYFVREENMLSEWETPVKSEGSKKSLCLRHYLDKMTLDPIPTDYGVSDRNQLANNVPIPTLGDNSWHPTTQEEQEISSDHPQEELLPSESDVAESHLQSPKETEHPSPVSVLESPSEDETYSSGCFGTLSVDLKELQLQLHLLKLESLEKYTEEKDTHVLSNADCAGASNVLLDSGVVQKFRDDDDRDFMYLLDMLIESGICGLNENKLLDACHLLAWPVDQNVFYKLEKKYLNITSWSRSERKLLFDLISCIIEGLVTPYMNVHPRAMLKICPPGWDHQGITETLWQMVVKQRNELHSNQENKILEPGWFGLENDVNLIGIEIESMLKDDLLEELAGEFVLS
ncbi:hypothetical protein Cni_G23636 [Canna indica]|uniref:DUF4378 domain-containing protein n=1 Tax=Canna indica TaxID=4628 RepID=A0AAQ3KUS2_9LILI|nr:hypothetical protein Cni_G23636 [Canna indica]